MAETDILNQQRAPRLPVFVRAAARAATASSKLALPIQRSSQIDVARLRNILGVAKNTALRMVKAKLFRAMQHGGWRIDYFSVVEYCDYLRLEYRISARPVGTAKGMRRRDRDLLPFPLDETISVAKVREVLDCALPTVIKLIQEGKLVGYQVLVNTPGCPWRIHVRSLELYVAARRAAVHPRTRAIEDGRVRPQRDRDRYSAVCRGAYLR